MSCTAATSSPGEGRTRTVGKQICRVTCSQEASSFPAPSAGHAAQHRGDTGTSGQVTATRPCGARAPLGWEAEGGSRPTRLHFGRAWEKNYVTKAFVLFFRRKLPPARPYTTARMKFGEREWQPRRGREKSHLSQKGNNAGIPSVCQGGQGPSPTPWHPPCLSSCATQFCLCSWDSPSARCWKPQCHQAWASAPGWEEGHSTWVAPPGG